MPKTDPRIDAYIEKSQDFAKPILNHLRELVHSSCPGVEETMKWSFPHFDYKGILCNMAAFKNYCVFGFWKVSLLSDPHKILSPETAMGHIGHIKSLKDLPSDKILKEYIKEAAKLNEDGVKLPPRSSTKKEVEVPDYFMKALKKNKNALKTFENFSPSHKREYIEWITEAKREETRDKRIETALEWLADGKGRNWKYERNK